MSLISPTVRTNPISQSVLSEVTISQIIIGITFSLILVEFWRIFLETFIFQKLGIQRNSSFQTFIVALVLTIILILILSYVQAPVNDIIVGLDPQPAVVSKTQALLGGNPEVFEDAEQCKCRGCDNPGDQYNPNTEDEEICEDCISLDSDPIWVPLNSSLSKLNTY